MIIGGGLAGWRAAEAAVAGGASVTLVANGVGNSPDIHALNGPGLPEDSVRQFIDDTLSSGKYQNDPALIETMCQESVLLKDEFDFDDEAMSYFVWCSCRGFNADVVMRMNKDEAINKFQNTFKYLLEGLKK